MKEYGVLAFASIIEKLFPVETSFEKTLRLNASAKTFLIASCITHEVHERIIQDATISHYFNLTEVISSKEAYSQLMELLFSLLDE